MGGLEGGPPLGGGSTPSLPPITIGGGGGGADTGSVNTALQELESWVGDVSAWDQAYGNSLVGGLVDELKNIFGAIWNWLKSLADTWLGQLIQSVWDWLKNLYEYIKGFVETLLAWFKWYESLVNYYYQKIFGPLLQIISSLRRVLLIFRIFHLKFAEELDSWLAQREAALARIFLFYHNQINTIVNWLNEIINPFGLINEGLYLQSALQSIGSLWSALKDVGDEPLTSTQLQQQQQYSQMFLYKNVTSTAVTTAASGPSAEFQSDLAAQQQLLSSWGYTI